MTPTEQDAQLAIEYANKHILESSSLPGTPDKKIKEINEKIAIVRNKHRLTVQQSLKTICHFLMYNASNNHYFFKAQAYIVKQYQVGNCGEFSTMVMNYLRKNTQHRIENAYTKAGDHSFIVINRKSKSDINDPLTWGPDAVIIDAWAKKTYPASEIQQQLNCLVCIENQNTYTPYNPTFHQLQSNEFFHENPKHRSMNYELAILLLQKLQKDFCHNLENLKALSKNISADIDKISNLQSDPSLGMLSQRALIKILYQHMEAILQALSQHGVQNLMYTWTAVFATSLTLEHIKIVLNQMDPEISEHWMQHLCKRNDEGLANLIFKAHRDNWSSLDRLLELAPPETVHEAIGEKIEELSSVLDSLFDAEGKLIIPPKVTSILQYLQELEQASTTVPQYVPN